MLTTTASATFMDTIFNTTGTVNDGVCDGNEYPTDNDCAITTEVLNDFSLFQTAWFLRLIILIGIIFLLRNPDIIDTNLLAVILLIIIIFTIIPSGSGDINLKTLTPLPPKSQCPDVYEPICYGGKTYNNTCEAQLSNATTQQSCTPIYEIRQSNTEKLWDKTLHLGSTISPRYPLAGWTVMFLAIFIFIGLFNKASDVRDNFINLFFPRKPRR